MVNKPTDGNPPSKPAEDDWEFTTVKTADRPATSPEIGSKTKTHTHIKDTKSPTRKETALSLDDSAVPKMKTRSEMAAALTNMADEDEGELSFKLASVPKRAIAFVIDAAIAAVLGMVVYFTTPIVRSLIQIFLDKYKLQFWLPEPVVMQILFVADAVVMLFLFICLPVAFYNHSYGKKIVGLKIRGTHKYTLSIVQAIQREIVYKPLGILIVIGFFIPFFNKKHQALQDFFAETLVIEKE